MDLSKKNNGDHPSTPTTDSNDGVSKEDTFVIAGEKMSSGELRHRKAAELAKANARHVIRSWQKRHHLLGNHGGSGGGSSSRRPYLQHISEAVQNGNGEKIYFRWQEAGKGVNHRQPKAVSKLYAQKRKRLAKKRANFGAAGTSQSAPNHAASYSSLAPNHIKDQRIQTATTNLIPGNVNINNNDDNDDDDEDDCGGDDDVDDANTPNESSEEIPTTLTLDNRGRKGARVKFDLPTHGGYRGVKEAFLSNSAKTNNNTGTYVSISRRKHQSDVNSNTGHSIRRGGEEEDANNDLSQLSQEGQTDSDKENLNTFSPPEGHPSTRAPFTGNFQEDASNSNTNTDKDKDKDKHFHYVKQNQTTTREHLLSFATRKQSETKTKSRVSNAAPGRTVSFSDLIEPRQDHASSKSHVTGNGSKSRGQNENESRNNKQQPETNASATETDGNFKLTGGVLSNKEKGKPGSSQSDVGGKRQTKNTRGGNTVFKSKSTLNVREKSRDVINSCSDVNTHTDDVHSNIPSTNDDPSGYLLRVEDQKMDKNTKSLPSHLKSQKEINRSGLQTNKSSPNSQENNNNNVTKKVPSDLSSKDTANKKHIYKSPQSGPASQSSKSVLNGTTKSNLNNNTSSNNHPNNNNNSNSNNINNHKNSTTTTSSSSSSSNINSNNKINSSSNSNNNRNDKPSLSATTTTTSTTTSIVAASEKGNTAAIERVHLKTIDERSPEMNPSHALHDGNGRPSRNGNGLVPPGQSEVKHLANNGPDSQGTHLFHKTNTNGVIKDNPRRHYDGDHDDDNDSNNNEERQKGKDHNLITGHGKSKSKLKSKSTISSSTTTNTAMSSRQAVFSTTTATTTTAITATTAAASATAAATANAAMTQASRLSNMEVTDSRLSVSWPKSQKPSRSRQSVMMGNVTHSDDKEATPSLSHSHGGTGTSHRIDLRTVRHSGDDDEEEGGEGEGGREDESPPPLSINRYYYDEEEQRLEGNRTYTHAHKTNNYPYYYYSHDHHHHHDSIDEQPPPSMSSSLLAGNENVPGIKADGHKISIITKTTPKVGVNNKADDEGMVETSPAMRLPANQDDRLELRCVSEGMREGLFDSDTDKRVAGSSSDECQSRLDDAGNYCGTLITSNTGTAKAELPRYTATRSKPVNGGKATNRLALDPCGTQNLMAVREFSTERESREPAMHEGTVVTVVDPSGGRVLLGDLKSMESSFVITGNNDSITSNGVTKEKTDLTTPDSDRIKGNKDSVNRDDTIANRDDTIMRGLGDDDDYDGDGLFSRPNTQRPLSAGMSRFLDRPSFWTETGSDGTQEDDIKYINDESDFYEVFGYNAETAEILRNTQIFPASELDMRGSKPNDKNPNYNQSISLTKSKDDANSNSFKRSNINNSFTHNSNNNFGNVNRTIKGGSRNRKGILKAKHPFGVNSIGFSEQNKKQSFRDETSRDRQHINISSQSDVRNNGRCALISHASRTESDDSLYRHLPLVHKENGRHGAKGVKRREDAILISTSSSSPSLSLTSQTSPPGIPHTIKEDSFHRQNSNHFGNGGHVSYGVSLERDSQQQQQQQQQHVPKWRKTSVDKVHLDSKPFPPNEPPPPGRTTRTQANLHPEAKVADRGDLYNGNGGVGALQQQPVRLNLHPKYQTKPNPHLQRRRILSETDAEVKPTQNQAVPLMTPLEPRPPRTLMVKQEKGSNPSPKDVSVQPTVGSQPHSKPLGHSQQYPPTLYGSELSQRGLVEEEKQQKQRAVRGDNLTGAVKVTKMSSTSTPGGYDEASNRIKNRLLDHKGHDQKLTPSITSHVGNMNPSSTNGSTTIAASQGAMGVAKAGGAVNANNIINNILEDKNTSRPRPTLAVADHNIDLSVSASNGNKNNNTNNNGNGKKNNNGNGNSNGSKNNNSNNNSNSNRVVRDTDDVAEEGRGLEPSPPLADKMTMSKPRKLKPIIHYTGMQKRHQHQHLASGL